MRGRRGIAIVIGVVGFILLLLIVVLALTNQQSSPAPQPPANGEAPVEGEPGAENGEGGFTLPFQPEPTVDPSTQLVEVVVSLQTVPRGWQMSAAELYTDLRIASEVSSNVVTRIDDAIGLYARRDIFQGETLTVDVLATDPRSIGRENYGPSSLIPPGWVAQAIPIDRLSGVGYGMLPGDSVDLVTSFMLIQLDEEFQSILNNSVSFYLETVDEEGNRSFSIFVIDPYGRFDQLENQDLAHIIPSEPQRPILVSMAMQNAKVISVGPWIPPGPVQPPTPTPDPLEPTPTPDPSIPPTPTPAPPDVLLLAMPPQQQLILRYALDSNAPVMVGLRGVNDGQLYSADSLNLEDILLQYFNFTLPPTANYTLYYPGMSPASGGESGGE
jgi:Flp pilus assembly protein CpaB